MRTIRLLGTALCLVSALGGCTDDRQSFFIRFNGAPTEGDCIVAPDRNADYRTMGTLDLDFATQTYVLYPVVENAMDSSKNLNPLTAEANRIMITGAQVRLSTETGERLGSGDFFVPLTTTIDPGGVASMGFVAVPAGYVAGVTPGQMVIIETKMLGITGGGLEVDTPWFSFPVATCSGCLADLPDGATMDTTGTCYICPTTTTDTEPCAPGQDTWKYSCCEYSTAYCDSIICG